MRRLSMLRRHNSTLILFILLVGVVGWFLIPFATHAQTATPLSIESVGQQVGLGGADLKTIVIRVIQWALGFLSLLAVSYIIYGGYLWLTAAGREQQIEKAKQVILQALIGIVIILLAWAIVYFVVKTTKGVTGNSNNGNTNGSCLPGDPGCTTASGNTFNITTIATCAQAPDYAKNVPLSSKVAVFFNQRLDDTTAKKAVEESKNMIASKCADNTCAAAGITNPKPVDTQKFTVGASTSTATTPVTEWVTQANSNAVTLEHTSFSNTETDAGYRLFDKTANYRIQLPKSGATNALVDATILKRQLAKCQSTSGGPIPGETAIGENCHIDVPSSTLQWSFATGEQTDGPALNVVGTSPSSNYLAQSGATPNRNVSPGKMSIGIHFNNAVDPTSFTKDNFVVKKFSAPPTAGGNWKDGTTEATALPADTFDAINYRADGTGGSITLASGKFLESFTWYQVTVSGVRNLCGTAMVPETETWVFETNDTMPGVAKVYPSNGFDKACPDTKVEIIFNTSMWDGASATCDVGAGGGSLVTSAVLKTGGLASGRNLKVVDQYDPDNPDTTCRIYEFDPTSVPLTPDVTYSASVYTDMVMNKNGDKLQYGDGTSGKPWHFTARSADKCVRPPLITAVAPQQGKDGQCVSVLGNYFEKPSETTSNGKPEPGDALTLGNRNQLTDPEVSWMDKTIVTTVDAGTVSAAGSLDRDKPYIYSVTVNYPAPIGPLTDTAPYSFFLDSGTGSQGPCLRSISPTSGPAGTDITANGKRFGAYDAPNDRITYPLHPQGMAVDGTTWADTRIGKITVRDTTGIGTAAMSVVTAGGQSNPVNFETTEIPTPAAGAPTIVQSSKCSAVDPVEVPSPNPRPGSSNACLNVQPEVYFSIPMDGDSLRNAANVNITDCTTGTCAAVSGVGTNFVRGDNLSVQLTTPKLDPNHTYKIFVSGNVASTTGIKMGRDVSWTFQTQVGTADCAVTWAKINEGSKTYTTEPPFNPYPLSSSLRTADCQQIGDTSSIAFKWTSAPGGVVALNPDDQDKTVARGVATPLAGTDNISFVASGKNSNTIKISYDPTFCTNDAYCKNNGLCANSTCQASHCTPVVTSIDPTNGAPGTYTTINGCWFGAYASGISKVVYGEDTATPKDGLAPAAAQCGTAAATWHNSYIVREVPAGAVTGKVQVVRGDLLTANSADNYTVDATVHPGICKIAPNPAPQSTGVTISGIRLGSDDATKRPNPAAPLATQLAAQDIVLLSPNTAGVLPFLIYGSWSDTTIGTVVPTGAVDGLTRVAAKKNGNSSNAIPFTVGALSTGGGNCSQPCSGDGSACPNTADGVAQGCSLTTYCCAVKPVVASVSPTQGATNICRNIAAQVVFSQPLQSANVDAAHTIFTENNVAKTPTVTLQNAKGQATISIAAGLLGNTTSESLTFTPGALRGQNGVLADLSGLPLQFKTGPAMCALTGVVVRAVSTGENFYTSTFQGEHVRFEAGGVESHGWYIQNIQNVYSWDWSWLSSDATVASETPTDVDGYYGHADVVSGVPGKAFLSATATVTQNTAEPTNKPTKTGRALFTTNYCTLPWKFQDTASDCDVNNGPGNCTDLHFAMSYCRTTNGTPLPDFSYPGTAPITGIGAIEGNNAVLGRRKSMFFKAADGSTDAIGVLVFDNPNFLSPQDWIQGGHSGRTVSGTSTIGGYPAAKTGTTTYIGVTDISGGVAVGRMFVFDFNSNQAEGPTKTIFNKMLDSIQFNTNVGSYDDQIALQHDTTRRQELASVKALADTYKTANGSYPTLDSGSYVIGLSTSKWPSWQSALGSAFSGSVPEDPVNTFGKYCSNNHAKVCTDNSVCGQNGTCVSACPSGSDQSTCWTEATKKFICPAGSSVFLYRAQNGGIKLYANMEYTGVGSFSNLPANTDACTGTGSTCSCFNYQLSS